MFPQTTQAFIKFIVRSLAHLIRTRKGTDNVAKLFDLLDKHINEENCEHSAKELLKEYEKLTTV